MKSIKARAYNQPPVETVAAKGFYRVQITENGKIKGDSGFRRNLIVNSGYQDYLCYLLAGSAGSKTIGFVALGTGADPAAGDTGLANEVNGSTRKTAVTVAYTGSKTITFTATFASNVAITTQVTLKNIGLFHATSAAATIFAGSSYPTSTCNSNQAVNITYQVQFA